MHNWDPLLDIIVQNWGSYPPLKSSQFYLHLRTHIVYGVLPTFLLRVISQFDSDYISVTIFDEEMTRLN
jgi:hypothetical protein